MPDAPEAKVRARAGAIGFSAAMADTPVANLSGGEKARLLLGLATFEGPHLVVLDEPTNHLDIDSRAALIEAINDYSGAVILVSHDRYLLEACADRLWLVADGGVTPFDGDLDDYRRLVLGAGGGKARTAPPRTSRHRAPTSAAPPPKSAPSSRRSSAASTASTRPSRASTKRIAEIDATLADPKLYDRDPARVATLGKERADAAGALAAAEDQWLALSGEYEDAVGD